MPRPLIPLISLSPATGLMRDGTPCGTGSQAHDDALAVVNSPALVADQPRLRRDAWAALLAERGHRVNHPRVQAMQYCVSNLSGWGAFLLNPHEEP